MNKAELITKIAEDAGITKTQANATVDSFVEAVTKTLKGNGKVTGAVIKIKAKKVAKFKAGKDLSAKI